jgi:hypothetical protein
LAGPPPNKELVILSTFQVKVQTTGQVAGKNGGAPPSFTPCVALVVRANDGNAASINWGMGNNASDPLAVGETVAIDLPPGYMMDASQLCVSGTAGDQINVTAAVIQKDPGT